MSKKYLISQNSHDKKVRQGRTYEYEIYNLLGLKLRDYGNWFELSGSLQKFRNLAFTDDANNHTQFDNIQVCEAIILICGLLSVPAERLKLRGYEYAFNLHSSFDPAQTIKSNFICHRNNFYPFVTSYGLNGRIKSYKFDNFVLKFYDKGKHQYQKENIFRIEHKVIKSRKHPHVNFLSDFLYLDNWQLFKKKLTDSVNDMIIVDEPDETLKEYNPKYWENLTDKKDRRKFKKNFDGLPTSRIKSEILSLIDTTFHKLICHDVTPRTFDQLYDQMSRCHTIYMCYRDNQNQEPEKRERTKTRKCVVTGIDISHQNKKSKFVSARTVEKLDIETFENLVKQYLPLKSYNLSKDIKYNRIAHNIRNQFHNPKQRPRRMRAAGQLILF